MCGSKSKCTSQPHRDCTKARLQCSLIFPFPGPCFPREPAARHTASLGLPAPTCLSSIHSQPEVQPLQDKILAATCPQEDFCSCTSCSPVVQGTWHLKGGKRSWGTCSVPCVSDNYKGWEESNCLKTTGKQ